MLRRVIFALAFCLPGLAFADQAVEGNWKADLGNGVIIIMSVTAKGEWASKTVEKGEPIAAMSGTYTQAAVSPTQGRLVFTPDLAESNSNAEHGAPEVETDDYELQNGVLRLTSSDGDTMVFHKQ